MTLILLILLVCLYFLLKKNKNEYFSNFKNIDYSEIVDKVYVINMDKDKERMKTVDEKLKKLGIQYKRISGVDGKKIYPKYKNKTKIRAGQLGCLLSHVKILEDAKKNNFENILVLEDDIIFCKNFKKKLFNLVKKVKKNEKEFDMLYLGCSQKHDWKDIIMKDDYYLGNKMDGTFAMILNKRIFNKTIQIANKLKQPIDRLYYNNIQKLNKSFCANPSLVSVNINEFSNTVGRVFLNNSYYIENKINLKDFEI